MKKIAGDIIILQKCTKNYNHMSTVPEIQSETDRIFCHFGPFFAILLPPPHNNQKNLNLKKMLQASGDAIILHMCIKNYNHLMYASCDMEYDRPNFVIL